MENEIENYLKNKFKTRLQIEVKFIDFRNYKILLYFQEDTAIINFIYDSNFDFNVNMEVLTKYCIEQIVKYYLGI